MKAWRLGAGVGALVSALVIGGASCGDDDDDGGGGGTQVDPDPLNLEIVSVTVPAGDGARPVVRFRVTDAAGTPVDLAAEIPRFNATPQTFPNTVPRFTLAQLDDNGNYRSLYASTVNPGTYTPPPGPVPPAAPATQATSQPPSSAAWPVADLTSVGGGTYEYTMPPINVTGTDRAKTHTLAGWVVRERSDSDSDVAMSSSNFVPGGGTAVRDEVVTDDACSRCHGVLQAHGTRRGVQLCITCHSPQTSDPETSRTVDFQVMIHKIHFGRDLPSVQAGTNYFIVGRNGALHDYSEGAFPWHDGVQHCTVCHSGEDGDNWRQRPSITACGSCHDNVSFTAGGPPACTNPPTTAPCTHTGGTFTITDPDDVATCATCHGPTGANPVNQYHHGD